MSFLLRQQQTEGIGSKPRLEKQRSAKQTEKGNRGELFSEKLEELITLEKSVALNSSVALKFGKKFVHCKSASNRFQPMLCYKAIFGVHFYS